MYQLWPSKCDKLVQMDPKLKAEFIGHKIRRSFYSAPKEQVDEIELQIEESINAGVSLEYEDGDYPHHCSPCFRLQPKGWWWNMET